MAVPPQSAATVAGSFGACDPPRGPRDAGPQAYLENCKTEFSFNYAAQSHRPKVHAGIIGRSSRSSRNRIAAVVVMVALVLA
jgi:hypothetical protein